jgi:hypothetical protein
MLHGKTSRGDDVRQFCSHAAPVGHWLAASGGFT